MACTTTAQASPVLHDLRAPNISGSIKFDGDSFRSQLSGRISTHRPPQGILISSFMRPSVEKFPWEVQRDTWALLALLVAASPN